MRVTPVFPQATETGFELRFKGWGRKQDPVRQEAISRATAALEDAQASYKAEVEPHLLGQLNTLDAQWDQVEVGVLKSREGSLRFNLSNPQTGQDMQVGISSPDTTGWFRPGKTLLSFFACFDYQRPNDSLYNSGVYTVQQPESSDSFKPFRIGLKQKIKIKVTRFLRGGVLYEKSSADSNSQIDRKLMTLVLKAAEKSGEQPALQSLVKTGKLT